MKTIVKKILSALVLSVAAGSALNALDFGGTFFNTSRIYTNDWDPVALAQQDGITAWLKSPLSADGKIYLAAEGTALFKYAASDLSDSGSGKAAFYFDLGLLKLGYALNVGPMLMQIDAGRFFVSEGTGLIFAQTFDGAEINLTSNRFNLGAFLGYTGLTSAHFVSMVSDGTVPNNSVYYCSSPYIAAGVNFSLPYLFANQTLGAEFVAAIGVPGVSKDNSDEKSSYISLLMNGPIVANLFYNFSTTLGIKDGISNLTQFNLSYYPPVLDASIDFSAIYASGENGPLKAFKGITAVTASYAYSDPNLSSMMKLGLSGSIKPLDVFFVGLGADLIFDLTDSFEYGGFEWIASAKYQIFTDLQVGLSFLQYYDKNEYDNNSVLTLNVILAF